MPPPWDRALTTTGDDNELLHRRWSEEAVRGSWESSLARSLSSPAVLEQRSSGPGVFSKLPIQGGHYAKMMDEWLARQKTDKHSTVFGAVSGLTRGARSVSGPARLPTSSSPSSATERQNVLTNSHSPPSGTCERAVHGSDDSELRNEETTPTELLGMGAFADARESR